MLKKYVISEGKLCESADENAVIFLYVNPNEAEKKQLVDEFGVDEHTLSSALDPNELSRLEYDEDHTAIIFKRPKNYSNSDALLFKASTMGVFHYRNRIIIIAGEDMFYFENKYFAKIESLQDIVLRLISQAIHHFIEHMKVISMITDELEDKISKSMENKNLLNLFSLSKSLVYYLNAIEANNTLIGKIKRAEYKMGFNESQVDLIEDLIIENNQCYRQAEIYSSILTGMMDVRASIVNNNLNVLMKQLTMINIVFMPLNLLAGIGGMSEFSMMTTGTFGIPWPAAYSAFMIAMVAIAFITYWVIKKVELHEETKLRNSSKKRKKRK